MEDEEADMNVKIKKSYCPPRVVKGNCSMEYLQCIILPWFNEFKVQRNPNFGGDKSYKIFEELAAGYESGALHPGDLKRALTKAINKILLPVRDYFKNDPKAADLKRVKDVHLPSLITTFDL